MKTIVKKFEGLSFFLSLLAYPTLGFGVAMVITDRIDPSINSYTVGNSIAIIGLVLVIIHLFLFAAKKLSASKENLTK